VGPESDRAAGKKAARAAAGNKPANLLTRRKGNCSFRVQRLDGDQRAHLTGCAGLLRWVGGVLGQFVGFGGADLLV